MKPPPIVLDFWVGYLSRCLQEWGLPTWGDVLIVEDIEWDYANRRIRRLGHLYTVDQYRARFNELATCGWSWLKLAALGVLNGDLVLQVVKPDCPPDGHAFTSVNVSGVSSWITDRGGFAVDDLVESRSD